MAETGPVRTAAPRLPRAGWAFLAKVRGWRSSVAAARGQVHAPIWVLLPVVALGFFFVALYLTDAHRAELRASFGLAGMWALAALLTGIAIGFLFGHPRTHHHPPPAGVSGAAGPAYSQYPNTNLEQISDWLTKLIVGASLATIRDLPGALRATAQPLATAMGGGPGDMAIAMALLVSFAVTGFFGGYLGTRLLVAPAFHEADRRMLAQPATPDQIEAKEEKEAREALEPPEEADEAETEQVEELGTTDVRESESGFRAARPTAAAYRLTRANIEDAEGLVLEQLSREFDVTFDRNMHLAVPGLSELLDAVAITRERNLVVEIRLVRRPFARPLQLRMTELASALAGVTDYARTLFIFAVVADGMPQRQLLELQRRLQEKALDLPIRTLVRAYDLDTLQQNTGRVAPRRVPITLSLQKMPASTALSALFKFVPFEHRLIGEGRSLVTVNVQNMPWLEALDLLCQSAEPPLQWREFRPGHYVIRQPSAGAEAEAPAAPPRE